MARALTPARVLSGVPATAAAQEEGKVGGVDLKCGSCTGGRTA